MTYEYLCEACRHEWETEQSISEKPLKRCPQCGKNRARRQVSGGAGFILKGGGWYADGYGNKSPAKTTSDAEAKPKSPEHGTGDSKPSEKTGGPKKEKSSKSESKANDTSQSQSKGQSKGESSAKTAAA